MRTALLVTPSSEGWFLPSLLHESGWQCDVVSLSDIYELSRYVGSLFLADNSIHIVDYALTIFERNGRYSWVIVASDEVLGEIKLRSLLDQRYTSLLPVVNARHRAHLFSKIGLSRALDGYGIPTPSWRVASGLSQALQCAQDIGFPCFVKKDAANGGKGVFYTVNPEDLLYRCRSLESCSFLVQEEIQGLLWSVEALFWKSELQAYATSICEQTMTPFGPSLVRQYGHPREKVFEIQNLCKDLGKALGAHGFANISLIQAVDAGLYCIEADLRPNVWLALDGSLGGSFAKAIELLPINFSHEPLYCYESTISDQLTLTHPQRLIQMGGLGSDEIKKLMYLMPVESERFVEELVGRRFIPFIA